MSCVEQIMGQVRAMIGRVAETVWVARVLMAEFGSDDWNRPRREARGSGHVCAWQA